MTDLEAGLGADPPSALKVTVYVLAVHRAWRVWLAALATTESTVTWVPVPPGPVHQPAKVWPAREVVASAP